MLKTGPSGIVMAPLKILYKIDKLRFWRSQVVPRFEKIFFRAAAALATLPPPDYFLTGIR